MGGDRQLHGAAAESQQRGWDEEKGKDGLWEPTVLSRHQGNEEGTILKLMTGTMTMVLAITATCYWEPALCQALSSTVLDTWQENLTRVL